MNANTRQAECTYIKWMYILYLIQNQSVTSNIETHTSATYDPSNEQQFPHIIFWLYFKFVLNKNNNWVWGFNVNIRQWHLNANEWEGMMRRVSRREVLYKRALFTGMAFACAERWLGGIPNVWLKISWDPGMVCVMGFGRRDARCCRYQRADHTRERKRASAIGKAQQPCDAIFFLLFYNILFSSIKRK